MLFYIIILLLILIHLIANFNTFPGTMLQSQASRRMWFFYKKIQLKDYKN